MIDIIIFEDEPVALRRLKRLIAELRPSWRVIATHDRIEGATELLKSVQCDLVLADIQLSDGNSFKIFSGLNPAIPLIFITAFDKYAVDAFEFNSVHYILKPVQIEKLHQAFCKFEENQMQKAINVQTLAVSSTGKRLLSRVGNKTTLISHEEIVLIYYKNRSTKALLFSGKEHFLDQTMEHLEETIPGNTFFRINRQFIINKTVIREVKKVSVNRLLLITIPAVPFELIVSKEKTPFFKTWMA